MSRLYLVGVAMLMLMSCSRNPELSLSDLKFPDPARDFIKQNKVDTTFTIFTQEDGTVLPHFSVYDEDGRVVYDTSYRQSGRYHYDSNGFLIYRRHFFKGGIMEDSARYEFDGEARILIRKWKNSRAEQYFYFNKKGMLIKSVEFDPSWKDRQTATYTYDGDLLRKWRHVSDEQKGFWIENTLYYTPDGIIDSVALITDNGHKQYRLYDNSGLLKDDGSTTRFVHKKKM